MSGFGSFGISPYRSVMALNRVNQLMERNLERISTGYRVNRASDDPAGIAVASHLRAQDRSAGQAMRNTNQGISLAQTAEGAMKEVGNILDRMRELAVQSSSETLTSAQRASIDDEFDELSAEIDRISDATEFNDINLTDGSTTSIEVQVGVDGGTASRVKVSLSNIGASELGVDTGSIDLSTSGGASSAITEIDSAIDSMNSYRSSMGASQNRMESSLGYMESFQAAARAAQGSIMDADMAFEVAESTRLQVLQAGGVAALVQARRVNESLIGLLQS